MTDTKELIDFIAPDERLAHNAGLRLAEGANLIRQSLARLDALEAEIYASGKTVPESYVTATRKDMLRAWQSINEACQDAGFWIARSYLERVKKWQPSVPVLSRWQRLLMKLRLRK